jgi:hypothetical protein
MNAAWDKWLDWWEFTAERFIRRHQMALAVLAVALAALAVIASTLAYAADVDNTEGRYVLMPAALVQEAIDMIERLEAENKRLRERCPRGAVAI